MVLSIAQRLQLHAALTILTDEQIEAGMRDYLEHFPDDAPRLLGVLDAIDRAADDAMRAAG
jgi:hypothetical protein